MDHCLVHNGAGPVSVEVVRLLSCVLHARHVSPGHAPMVSILPIRLRTHHARLGNTQDSPLLAGNRTRGHRVRQVSSTSAGPRHDRSDGWRRNGGSRRLQAHRWVIPVRGTVRLSCLDGGQLVEFDSRQHQRRRGRGVTGVPNGHATARCPGIERPGAGSGLEMVALNRRCCGVLTKEGTVKEQRSALVALHIYRRSCGCVGATTMRRSAVLRCSGPRARGRIFTCVS
jgi:hypothetical protein